MADLTLESRIFTEPVDVQLEQIGFAYVPRRFSDSPHLSLVAELAVDLAATKQLEFESGAVSQKAAEAGEEHYRYWTYPLNNPQSVDEREIAAILLASEARAEIRETADQHWARAYSRLQSYSSSDGIVEHYDVNMVSLSHLAIVTLTGLRVLNVRPLGSQNMLRINPWLGDLVVFPSAGTLGIDGRDEVAVKNRLCKHSVEPPEEGMDIAHSLQTFLHPAAGILPEDVARIAQQATASSLS